MQIFTSGYVRLLSCLIIIIVLSFIGLYAFFATEVIKIDVSPPDSFGPIVVPENYKNLLVLDVTIPSYDAGRAKEDTKIHNGIAASNPREPLSKFLDTNWYSDYDDDTYFDGNIVSGNAEPIILSNDDLLDSNDVVEKSGLCFFKIFSISSGIGEQFIDSNHSQSYNSGEAIVRTSIASGKLYPGEVIRAGSADMTLFGSDIRFTDGINGNITPAQYDQGEAIISSKDSILESDDLIITPGNADLKPFASNIIYTDSDNDGKYGNLEAIISDGGTPGKLDLGLLNGSGADKIIRSGKANLKPLSGTNFLYSDDNNDNSYSPNEMIILSSDNNVDSGEIRLPGLANLKPMDGLSYADDNNNDQLNISELIIKNTGAILDILEPEDTIVRPGNAALRAFGINEQFIDNNKDSLYNNGECIISDSISGIINPANIKKPGKALLRPFSGNGYFFTEFAIDGKYTGDINLSDGYQGEAIFRDLNNNNMIDNGELVTPGYADIRPIPANTKYIDAGQPGPRNGIYNSGEAIILSSDDILSTADTIINPGPAFLTAFDSDMRWADVNSNNQYNDNELIVKSIDNILSNDEIIKPGYCKLLSLSDDFSGQRYSDNNGDNIYNSQELVIYTNDNILDPSDVVSKQGKACLLSLKNQTNTRYIDRNLSRDFDSQEAIVYDPGADPLRAESILDIADKVLRSLPGTVDIKSFTDDVVYMDCNGDGYFRGDSDNDVDWDVSPYFNHPNVVNDQDEVVLKDPIGNRLRLDSSDVVIRPGVALLTLFSNNITYTDDGDNGFDGDMENEAVINDSNENLSLDSTDIVLVTGKALIRDFYPPVSERFIDANLDGTYQLGEAVIIDSSPDGAPNRLLDAGPLDGTGIDQIVLPGNANLKKFQRAEKFVDGNRNGNYEAGEAIVYDWYKANSFEGEYILAGNPDLRDPSGILTYSPPGNRERDMVLLASQSEKAPMVQMNHRPEHKYIDRNHSGTCGDFYDPVYEAIIWSNNNDLDEGSLDGTGIDRILACGHAGARFWLENLKWADSNHNGQYEKNEAIIYDSDNDNIIKSIGTAPYQDEVRMPGEADLKEFPNMKYVDANKNGKYDEGELLVNDFNQDDMIQSGEIIESGAVPGDLFLPFSPSNYRFTDSNADNLFNSQEAIVLDQGAMGILESTDLVISSGYAGIMAFASNYEMIDSNHNNIYNTNEGIINGNGDQIISTGEEIITPGIADSFNGTKFKYTSGDPDNAYISGWLIVNDTNDDDILHSNEIVTSGRALLMNFNASKDRYSDHNHNDLYDYNHISGFGEAIIINTTGLIGTVEPTDKIETPGYADLQSLDATKYRYSDSDRDNNYAYNELVINDLNTDNRVDNSEIVIPGLANMKSFDTDVLYSDDNNDGSYSSLEAIIRSSDNNLSSDDQVLAAGNARFRAFEQNTYRFTDANHNGLYDPEEATLVETGWGVVDDILEESDIIILPGAADIEQFSSDFMFLDDNTNSNNYEDGEAIVKDSNLNSLLDPGEIITGGRAALWKFGAGERYIDFNRNGYYDQDEAIVKDGNSNGNLDYGPLNGSGTDTVLLSGKANLRQFRDFEKYNDQNKNAKYDGAQNNSEDIYLDNDDNGIITMGDDVLEYFVVTNTGSATNSDFSSIRLWADKDKDGQFEPTTDDAPSISNLISDASNPKMWYAGPAFSPPLSAPSGQSAINYAIRGSEQRFFVTVDTSSNPSDGKDLRISLPIKGVKTAFAPSSPTDAPLTNAYTQKIDFANPSISEITSPAPGAIVRGQITLKANAADSVQVGKVEFYKGLPGAGNTPIAIDDNGPPWEAIWDTSGLTYGPYTIYARVYDRTYLKPPQVWGIPHYKDSQGTNIIIAVSASIPLQKGWNFISVPVESFNTSLSSVFSSIAGNFSEVWSYTAATAKWQRYDLTDPEFLNDLTEIRAGAGYWILMTAPDVLEVYGNINNEGITLQAGWNMVGCKSLNPMNVVQATSSLSGNFSVWTYNLLTDQWLNYDPKESTNDLQFIEPGKAYWIYTDKAQIWTLP